jgi:hypothetical protein
MFIVSTQRLNGKRCHFIVNEETNKVVPGGYYTDMTKARKAAKALNRAEEKQKKKWRSNYDTSNDKKD